MPTRTASDGQPTRAASVTSPTASTSHAPWWWSPVALSEPSFSFMERPQRVLQADSSIASGRPSGEGEKTDVDQSSKSSDALSTDSFRMLGRNMQPFMLALLHADPELDPDPLDPLTCAHVHGHVASLLTHHILPKAAAGLIAAQRHLGGGVRSLLRQPDDGDALDATGGHTRGHGGGRVTVRANAEAQQLADAALRAQSQSNPVLAAALYEQLVAVQPAADNYARWSKQLTDSMYEGGVKADRERTVQLNTRAIEVADMAIAADSSRPLGHIARCVSRGRLALVMDNRTKVQLAKEAADDAANALAVDPNSDLAHHLMGRWHYEMAQIPAIARTLIRLFFGTSLMSGSYTEALQHFRTATQLCPSRAIHHVELGRTMLKLGDTDGALRELSRSLEMEVEDINALLQQQDAQLLLGKLRSPEARGLYLETPSQGPGGAGNGGT